MDDPGVFVFVRYRGSLIYEDGLAYAARLHTTVAIPSPLPDKLLLPDQAQLQLIRDPSPEGPAAYRYLSELVVP